MGTKLKTVAFYALAGINAGLAVTAFLTFFSKGAPIWAAIWAGAFGSLALFSWDEAVEGRLLMAPSTDETKPQLSEEG